MKAVRNKTISGTPGNSRSLHQVRLGQLNFKGRKAMKILQVGTIRLVMIVTALGLLAGSLGDGAEAGTGRDDEIKLSGCLIRGEEGAGYLLANGPGGPATFKGG